MLCPKCIGSGRELGSSEICQVCKGRGQLPDDRLKNPICPPCTGSGKKYGSPAEICPVCDGWGRLPNLPEVTDEPEGPMMVFVEAGKPRTAHLELSELFGQLRGVIRICDPYYGTGSLLRLDLLTHCDSIRFLTKTPDSKEKSFINKTIAEFVTQYPQFEFKTNLGGDLHDRLVLTERELIILGHGMKDIGGKDSFIIKLNRELAGDIIDQIQESFEQKWSNAGPII
jgi:hypothetical protein